MAKFNPILGELAGSIGDNVWSHNRGGPYVRRRATPTNPDSLRQTEVRTTLGILSAQWRTLTSVQREDWNAWAAAHPLTDPMGLTVNRTGQQCFVGLNLRNIEAGQAVKTSCPSDPAPTAPLTLVPTAVEGTQSVSVVFTPVLFVAPPNVGKSIWYTTQLASRSPGADPNFRQARLAIYGGIVSPQVVPLPMSPIEDDEFNIFAAFLSDEGQVSAYLKARVIVGAGP